MKANEWWTRAADTGHPGAMYNLGALAMDDGDHPAARHWWTRAADTGHPDAMYNLGALAMDDGDHAAARHWWTRAADTGHPDAMVNLGNLAADTGGMRATKNLALGEDEKGNGKKHNSMGREAERPPDTLSQDDMDDLITDIHLHLLRHETAALPGLRGAEPNEDDLAVETWVFQSRGTPSVTLSISELPSLEGLDPVLQIYLSDPAPLLAVDSAGWELTVRFRDGTQASLDSLVLFENGATWEMAAPERVDEIASIRFRHGPLA